MQDRYKEDIKVENRGAEDIEAALSERQEARKAKVAASQRRKKRRMLIIILLAFVLMATMCGRDIIRLKAENAELKKQQVSLEKQRDELKEELKNTGESEYIREQARKQLRLLNPGEILFTFEDDE
ncbi:MAG: septum formation initiator family protein [Mogibacterium sp.]|nr:septum formation initiator family protein [Mogibacterium sp.]